MSEVHLRAMYYTILVLYDAENGFPTQIRDGQAGTWEFLCAYGMTQSENIREMQHRF